jgi:hypothetical protein
MLPFAILNLLNEHQLVAHPVDPYCGVLRDGGVDH